jgi:DinB superfamily
LARPIVESIRLKLREQIERTEHLIRLVPSDKIGWDPRLPQGSTDVGHLLGHLLDCMAGFCAVFHAAFPQQLGDFSELQSLPVNHFCRPEEALSRIREYAAHIGQGFDLCTDNDLPQVVPSVFVPQGEPLATLLLGNLEHLINHKYQLFFYLKLLGIPVTTRDIYRWRGTPASTD